MHKKPGSGKRSTGFSPSRSGRGRPAGAPRLANAARSINDLLVRRPLLSRLAANAASQQSWTQWLCERLPADLGPHVVNVIPKGAELVILVDSAAWSTRVRYALAAVGSAWVERDPAIVRTRVRVAP